MFPTRFGQLVLEGFLSVPEKLTSSEPAKLAVATNLEWYPKLITDS